MAQSIQQERAWPPLVCICSLCECGGHKCSDFADWLAGPERPPPPPDGDDAAPPDARAAGHTCSYTRSAALGERYLSGPGTPAGRSPRPERAPDGHDTPADSARSGSPGPRPSVADVAEVLHVLVTRPQVASRPRDNIVFEGDMDLRTTFETSYEALAKARLEHWKRHQELKRRGRRDVSDSEGRAPGRQSAGAPPDSEAGHFRAARGDPEPRGDDSSGHVSGRRADGNEPDAGEAAGAAAVATSGRPTGAGTPDERPARARAADRGFESKQECTPAAAADAASLEARAPAGAPAAHQLAGPPPAKPMAEPRKQPPRRPQQDHFIDPDLSPIIVYDANLNRLERVGLRKRSKYRPSTSLRPGGRGFFGPAEGDQAAGHAEKNGPAAADQQAGPHNDREKRDAQPGGVGARDRIVGRAAAGASSETLNRDQSDCGRKHHHAHVNRIDHIKQLSLVESHYQALGEMIDSATSTDGDIVRMDSRPADHERRVDFAADGQTDDATGDDNERRIALEEEAAAVAEIQRLVVGDEGAAGRETDCHPTELALSSSRQSNGQIKQTTANTSPAASRPQTNSPASTQAGGRCSSRHSRMERVCQNQSFYLFENDYPTTRASTQDERHCIKIGGRETVELSKQMLSATPQSASVRQNLFRESPDFIMTTGHMQGHRLPGDRQHVREDQDEITTRNLQTQRTSTSSTNQQNDELERGGALSAYDANACRVLDLGREYEFVGSRLGHKYFVEKHVMTTPMSELG